MIQEAIQTRQEQGRGKMDVRVAPGVRGHIVRSRREQGPIELNSNVVGIYVAPKRSPR